MSLDDMDEPELLARLRASDPDDTRAFTELVHRYQDQVLTNCRFISGSADDAPDLAQEVMVKVFFGLGRFEGRSTLKTWIQRIKTNHCINFVKKRRPTFVDIDESALEATVALNVDPDAEARLEAMTKKQRIEKTLESLPDSLRIPLVLCDFDGLPYQDIADELGIGLSAVKMRIKRGREQFRALFGERASSDSEPGSG